MKSDQKFKSKIEKRRRLELDLLKIKNLDLKKSRWGQEKGPKPSLLSPHPVICTKDQDLELSHQFQKPLKTPL